jgi:hypothetical protein
MATIWFHTEQDDTCVTCSNIVQAYYISSALCTNPPSFVAFINLLGNKSYHILENHPIQIAIYNGKHDPPVYSGFTCGVKRIELSELIVNEAYIKRKNYINDINRIKTDMKRYVTQSMRELGI